MVRASAQELHLAALQVIDAALDVHFARADLEREWTQRSGPVDLRRQRFGARLHPEGSGSAAYEQRALGAVLQILWPKKPSAGGASRNKKPEVKALAWGWGHLAGKQSWSQQAFSRTTPLY